MMDVRLIWLADKKAESDLPFLKFATFSLLLCIERYAGKLN